MGKLDNLKSGQARGGFKPKKIDIGTPSDTPMATDETPEKVSLNVASTVPAKTDIPEITIVDENIDEKPVKEEVVIPVVSKTHADTPKNEIATVDHNKYEKTPETKTKRVNLGLQADVINYIKFKALRTGIPQYQLVTNIVGAALMNAKEKGFKYNTPALEPYKIKQTAPSHLGIEIPEILFNDVKEYARELLMTQTQFYSFALTEARIADVDFEY